MKQVPGKSSTKFSKGLVQGKHPWFQNRPLRFGVARLPTDEQTYFLAEVRKLFQAAPRYRSEAPGGVRNEILDKYFGALDEAVMEVVIDSNGRMDGIPLHFDLKRDEALVGRYLQLKGRLVKGP